jgi:ABC-type nitrate/sulfonate/bicarbonate transport system substrate-binding protein
MRTGRAVSAAVSLALLAGAAAACASSTGGTGAGSAGGGTVLQLGAQGLPIMQGTSFTMGNAAGDATIGDTVAYLVPQFLKQWGAQTNFQLGNGNNTELAVVSGQMATTAGPLDACVDAGLSVFGPNQVHVDYLLVSNKTSTVQGLKGKTVALATAVSPDQNLLTLALKQGGLTRSDIHTFLSGANSASVSAMVKGAVDAAWVHADALLQLRQHGTFNVLATGAQTAPYAADSYLCAKPSWLAANPGYAEAIDLAWIAAANTFNKNESGWVQAAQSYTKGADSAANDQAAYLALKQADPWSLDATAHFTTADLQQNFDQLKTAGTIKGQGDRPISQWLDTGPWIKAWAVYQAHLSAYGG